MLPEAVEPVLVAEPVVPLPEVELEPLLSIRPLISTSCPTWLRSSLELPSRTYCVPLMLDALADVPLPVVPLVVAPLPVVPLDVVPAPDVPEAEPLIPLLDPLPIFALARTKPSLLLEALALELPLVALPDVPVAPPIESARCRQPVTVTVPALLCVLLVCAAMLTPNASAAAATAPVHICLFM